MQKIFITLIFLFLIIFTLFSMLFSIADSANYLIPRILSIFLGGLSIFILYYLKNKTTLHNYIFYLFFSLNGLALSYSLSMLLASLLI
jgi:hypothetical protein